MRRTRMIWAAMLVVALALAACSGADDGTSQAAAGGSEAAGAPAADDEGIIRFTFSPDPAWDWIQDQGILEEMESESGYRILQTVTWDEFGQFAGRHADVVSVGSYETPILEQETGIETVTFGKFNRAKDVMITANPEYETASDLPEGCEIAAETVVGNTTIWQALIDELDGRELAEGSSDLAVVTADYQIIPTLVLEEEVCAAFADPTQSIPEFASGELNIMYDGRSASELFGESIVPGHEGLMSNNFIARKEWFDTHQDEAAFFLQVWQRALDEWAANRDEIIDAYPEHFAVESDEEAAWIKDYFDNTFDWFVDSPYLTQDWIEGEQEVFALLQRAGLVEEGAEFPEHAVIEP